MLGASDETEEIGLAVRNLVKSQRRSLDKNLQSRLTAISSLGTLLLIGCSVAPVQPPLPPDPVKAAARSLSIVRSASPQNPKVLKILFYGQSITSPKWTDQALAKLRRRYPNVTFDARNLALGGWSSSLLERAALRDISDFYPDLIVFHVYGDHRAYERIIQIMRSRTAADVIVQTDHVVDPVEPLCDQGIRLRWSPPPGCKGHIRFKQHVWEEFMSGVWIPTLAQKYDLSIEPRRQRWDRYLKSHKLSPSALLADKPHPNDKGWALMANLFVSWFDTLVARSDGAKPTDPLQVRTLAGPSAGETKVYKIEGNRVELVASGPLNGKVVVTVDGKPPADIDGCWIDSRVSRLPNLPDWPAIKQVSVRADYHREDRWTVRVTGLNPSQDSFDFTVESALHGKDGGGSSTQSFVSPSERITVEQSDWNLAAARRVSGKGVAEGTSFTWKRQFACTDQPPVLLANGKIEQRHVLATGLANGRHIVKLTVKENAPKIGEVRLYRPPLK